MRIPIDALERRLRTARDSRRTESHRLPQLVRVEIQILRDWLQLSVCDTAQVTEHVDVFAVEIATRVAEVSEVPFHCIDPIVADLNS